MAFGFPARFRQARRFNLPQHEIMSDVSRALEALGWTHTRASASTFTAHINATLYSWGEDLWVEIAPDGTITTESRCALATQCFDWGKNSDNVERFFARLEQTMAQSHQKTAQQISRPDEAGLSPVGKLFNE